MGTRSLRGREACVGARQSRLLRCLTRRGHHGGGAAHGRYPSVAPCSLLVGSSSTSGPSWAQPCVEAEHASLLHLPAQQLLQNAVARSSALRFAHQVPDDAVAAVADQEHVHSLQIKVNLRREEERRQHHAHVRAPRTECQRSPCAAVGGGTTRACMRRQHWRAALRDRSTHPASVVDRLQAGHDARRGVEPLGGGHDGVAVPEPVGERHRCERRVNKAHFFGCAILWQALRRREQTCRGLRMRLGLSSHGSEAGGGSTCRRGPCRRFSRRAHERRQIQIRRAPPQAIRGSRRPLFSRRSGSASQQRARPRGCSKKHDRIRLSQSRALR